jgi:hypothetical protein
MDTKPIFAFLKEVRKPMLKKPCTFAEIDEYDRFLTSLLYDMKSCLTDCLAENPSFDLSHIKKELRDSLLLWRSLPDEEEVVYEKAPTGDAPIPLVIKDQSGKWIDNPDLRVAYKRRVSTKALKEYEEKPETRYPAVLYAAIKSAQEFIDDLTGGDETHSPQPTIVETPNKKKRQEKGVEKNTLSAKEVASLFGIPYNNVKDKKWRDRHCFPCRQLIPGGKVIFYADEVREWINNNER